MADFGYEVGIQVDSSGIDAFIAKVKSLVGSVEFGGKGFSLPPGVTASGPGITGGVASLASGAQAVQFAKAVQDASLAALRSARGSGASPDVDSALRQVKAITDALGAGARQFEKVLGGPAGVSTGGLIVPAAVAKQQQEDAARQGKVKIAEGLTAADAAESNRIAAEKARFAPAALITEANNARKEILDELQKAVKIERGKVADLEQSPDLTRRIAEEEQQLLAATVRRAEIEKRAAARADYALGTQSKILDEQIQTARSALQLAQSNPAIIKDIAQKQVELASLTDAEVRIKREAVAAARLRAGKDVLVSDVATGALRQIPNEVQTEQDAASLRQQAAKRKLDAERTARAEEESLARAQRQRELDAQRERAGLVREAEAVGGFGVQGTADATTQAEILTARKAELDSLRKRLQSVRLSTGFDEEIARKKAEILVAEQEIARGERRQAGLVFAQAHQNGLFQGGTFLQRVQAAFKSRDGVPVDPLTQPRGGALVGQRVFQASSFAIGGLAFYGALQVLRETIEESENLEREFRVVEGQIQRTFGTESREAFERFKESVRSISLETGQLASDVALVQRQLTAAFVDATAPAGVREQQQALANENTDLAFKFAEVTGLDSKEIVDSLTAIGLSFDELGGDFQPILDRAIELEEEFGVLGGQIITFTADLAPLAANLGFSATQLEELGAAAQKFSGRSGAVLSEQFGRILTDLPTKGADLIALFSQTPALADLSNDLATAFVQDNMEQVLEYILTAASRVRTQNLDKGLVQRISETVAGRREGASFAAILREPQQLLEALQDSTDGSAGAVEDRWQEVRKSLSETMDRLRRAVDDLAGAILNAGLADALKSVASLLGVIASGATTVLGVFSKLNDFTGGLAGQFAALYLSLKAVDAAIKAIAASDVLKLLAPRVVARAGAIAAGPGALAGARAAPGLIAGAAGRLPYAAGFALGRAGGALGGLFSGGIGAGATSLAAPIAAGFLVQRARSDLAELRKLNSERSEELRLVARGASFRDLLRAYEVPEDPEEGTKLFGVIPGTQGVRSAIQRTALRFTGADPRNDVREAGVEVGPAALQAGIAAINQNLLDSGQIDDLNKAYTETEKALRGEEANLENVVEFLGNVSAGNEAIGDAVGNAVEKSIEVDTAAKEATQSVANLDQLVSALSGNRTTPELVRQALDQAIEPLQKLADAALEDGDYVLYLSQLEQIATVRKTGEGAISEYARQTISFSEGILDIFGDSTPQSKIETARAVLRDPNVTDDDVRLQALRDLQAGREALFNQQLALAESEAEKAAILARGPGVDPLAKVEAVYQQVARNVATRLAELQAEVIAAKQAVFTEGVDNLLAIDAKEQEQGNLANVSKEAIRRVSEQLIDDIEQYGDDAVEIRLYINGVQQAAVRAAIAALEHSQGLLAYAKKFELGVDLSRLEEDQAALEAVLAGEPVQVPSGGPSPEQQKQANDEAENYAKRLREAQSALRRAQVAGDPIAEAAVGIQDARDAIRFAKDDAERIQGEAKLVTALRAQHDAFVDIARAQLELHAAQNAKNPLEAAKDALRIADLAVANARGTAERLRAEAQRAQALESVFDVMRDIVDARLELVTAIAEAGGDTVEAARLRVEAALNSLSRARKTGDEAGIDRARAEVVNAERAYADSILSKQQGDIQFALEMGNITKRQAIESYQALLTIPTNTEEQNRELQLIIKRLQGELQQDFQFNLPTFLGLPTLYEARRVDQGGGGSAYNDNRVITVTVQASTNADPNAIAATVASVVGEPNRTGAIPRRYY